MKVVNGLSEYKSSSEIQVEIEEKVCEILNVLLSNDIKRVDINKIAAKLYEHFKPILARSANVSIEECEFIVKQKINQITELISSGMRTSKEFLKIEIVDKPRSRSSLIMSGDDERMIEFIHKLKGEYFSPSEVARIMNKSRRTISDWISNGTIEKEKGLRKHKSIPISEVVRVYRLKKIYEK